jgi:hypothetical protein
MRGCGQFKGTDQFREKLPALNRFPGNGFKDLQLEKLGNTLN